MASSRIGIGLAPMLGVTDFPVRLWVALAGAPARMTTPYLRVTAATTGGEVPWRFAPELGRLAGCLPYVLTPQILGGDPEHLARVAGGALGAAAPVIELNCGCPAPAAAGPYAGSRILQHDDRLKATLGRLVGELGPGRLAVKIRAGFANDAGFEDRLALLGGLPLARLTVHGRTAAQGYQGTADWDYVRRAVSACRFPVWGSGDIADRRGFRLRVEGCPGIAGVLVGRAGVADPWRFKALGTGEDLPEQAAVSEAARAAALWCLALLLELWQRAPDRLLARIANGRLPADCGSSVDAWLGLNVQLCAWLGIPPAPTRSLSEADWPGVSKVTRRRVLAVLALGPTTATRERAPDADTDV